MIVQAKVKEFLANAQPISIGYSEIHFFAPDALSEGQIGFSIDFNGNSLTGQKEGDWKESWLVIGLDHLGDPIFIDNRNKNTPVLSSQHGHSEWETTLIADSLENFQLILKDLADLSYGRETPSELEQNPFDKKIVRAFLNKLKDNNPQTELWFWETFLDEYKSM